MFYKTRMRLRQQWIFYLIGFTVILGIKYSYSKSGSNDLQWILAPTARWAGLLGGLSFENVPDIGYVSHECRFIIAPSCSGVQFMMVSIATLLFSFVHRMKGTKKGLCWTGLSIAAAYLATVLVNGLRIVLAIYVPAFIRTHGLHIGGITPEQLHTVIGIAVYFTSLSILYHMAGYISLKIADMPDTDFTGLLCADTSAGKLVQKFTAPMFWYFAIVLGVPLLNGACANNGKAFAEYALIMAAVCMAVIALLCLASQVMKHFRKYRQ